LTIKNIIRQLEILAPSAYQESYDNCGLLTGNPQWDCSGILCTLDATEEIVLEAKQKGCNLIVAHHPIIFGGLKKITGKNYVEKTVIAAIKNDIAIYAVHTNLDNVLHGVNNKIADKLRLVRCRILSPKPSMLSKLVTFVPLAHAEVVRAAIFAAGGGNIGNYSECSFNHEGIGTFKAGENAHPFAGEKNIRHEEKELRIEIIFPQFIQSKIIDALIKSHPYEEPAFDIIPLKNDYSQVGSGLLGELETAISEQDFLQLLKAQFGLQAIKHTALLGKNIQKVALCGGAGSFLIKTAIAAGADIYITADVKYHEFFDADNHLVIADIGHWESEQFTIDLLFDFFRSKYSNFAVQKSEIRTNPVYYFI
jgi:dinuclear metal center YbgI/SA1388 family protein